MTRGPGVARTVLPKGFYTSGINSGVRRYRPDLGVIISEVPSVVAGVFTLNECKGAPIIRSQKLLPSNQIRAILTNSGQANSATGEKGVLNDLLMAQSLAQALGCNDDQVLTASTGVIGVQVEVGKITQALPDLLRRKGVTAEPFALAILTTDLVPKTASIDVHLENGTVRITGICKGSGMIHPNMATMLGYFLTDAVLTPESAQRLLKGVNELSFNMISVDGESSTNDCVFLMANGASGIELKSENDTQAFQSALEEIATFLAQSIARDGEGASKLIEAKIIGVPNLSLAKKAARGLVMSPLIKTAIYGEDPNWGRILARLGADSVPLSCLNKMTLKIQGTELYSEGAPVEVDLSEISKKLAEDTVLIEIDLKSGGSTATAWGCDLTEKYVSINAEYTT